MTDVAEVRHTVACQVEVRIVGSIKYRFGQHVDVRDSELSVVVKVPGQQPTAYDLQLKRESPDLSARQRGAQRIVDVRCIGKKRNGLLRGFKRPVLTAKERFVITASSPVVSKKINRDRLTLCTPIAHIQPGDTNEPVRGWPQHRYQRDQWMRRADIQAHRHRRF